MEDIHKTPDERLQEVSNCNTSTVPLSLKIQAQRSNIQNRNHNRGETRLVTGAWNRRNFVEEKQIETNMSLRFCFEI